jgi:hypothetical protein
MSFRSVFMAVVIAFALILSAFLINRARPKVVGLHRAQVADDTRARRTRQAALSVSQRARQPSLNRRTTRQRKQSLHRLRGAVISQRA